MDKLLRSTSVLGGGLFIAGVFQEFFLYDVDAGTRAVIFDKINGLKQETVGEGTHFKIPYIQVPIIIDVRDRPRSIHSVTGTKDLQNVNISLRVLSRPKEDMLPVIYQTLGYDFDERVLPSLGNEVLKSIVAQYNAEELLSKRAVVAESIKRTLIKRAEKFNLILDDVSVTHLTFGKEFAKAIEHKQVAQQEAETQMYVVARSDQERKAAVIRAEGEAEAAELISKAMETAGNGFIEVRRIDAAKEVAATLGRSKNITYLPSGGDGTGSNLLLGLNNQN